MLWATVISFSLLSLGPSLAAKPASNNPANNNNNINDNNNADEANKVPPCTVVNTANKAFYDLSSLSRPIIDKSSVKPASWNARGFDYGYNFTLGVCASPLSVASSQKNANNIYNSPNDIDSSIKNASLVGGYYTGHDGIKYSIGNFNSTPVFRGKKLLLTYTNGSYCKDPHAKPGSDGYLTDAFGKKLRKSTILSFTCDKEIMAKASVSFIGALNDCDYFFEVRTAHACITPKKADDLAAIWIFMFILFAALSVYFSGGFLYKTFFLRRKGWNQLPTFNNSFKRSFANYRDGRLFHDNASESNAYNDNVDNEDHDDTNQLLDQLDINLERMGHGRSDTQTTGGHNDWR